MTAELRNLPHIASMAFNEPLMLEPAYARVFFCALAGQLGISRLTVQPVHHLGADCQRLDENERGYGKT